MSLFIQGMRRSGTTILHDALLEDPSLAGFYEPLREQDVSIGGGSGTRDTDAFAETRALREQFQRERYPGVPIEEFNWGGPRDPALELDEALPDHCRDLLAFLIDQAPEVAIKETRLYRKLPALAAFDPELRLVHLVRDPRAVVTSMMLGRGRRHLERFSTADTFFEARTKRKLWSSRAISERLMARPEYSSLRKPHDHLRILMVWKECFEATHGDGTRTLRERYLLLRHEDLASDPGAAMARVYELAGRSAPDAVTAWAAANVRPPATIPFGDDPRWAQAAERIGLGEALDAAGYTDLGATLAG